MWFRRDLRLGDHPALLAAGAEGGGVVPVFVVDPSFARSGAARLGYLAASLRALDRSIRERSGNGLVIRHGDPTVEIPKLAAELDVRCVFVTRDYGPYGRDRDAAVKTALEDGGVRLVGVGAPYAVPPGSVRKADGDPYAVFTPFSASWRRLGWNDPEPPPADDFPWSGAGAGDTTTQPFPDDVAPHSEEFEAGEAAALDRWQAFVHGGLDEYAARRDLPAESGTSSLSPALKWGAVHPRQLLADLDASGVGEAAHTAFSAELAWREFYADVLFREPGSAWRNFNSRMDAMPVDTDAAARRRFDRWAAGETGFGIVDAGMRQLLATGWMHNRVRMIVASFLVKDLHLPWQWGARWFMEHLVDGDLASNNHGWQWAAGTGTDAAPYFRVFNPILQQERYDPDGAYVARWVTHPVDPMLDHAAERREALGRLAAIGDAAPASENA